MARCLGIRCEFVKDGRGFYHKLLNTKSLKLERDDHRSLATATA